MGTERTIRAKIGPEARTQALLLLADGYTVSAAARELSLRRNTVQAWRDSPEGQKHLATLRAERDAAMKDAAEDARRILRAGAVKAAQALVDALGCKSPAERLRAACAILDRVGVIRTERIETVSTGDGIDLSLLSDEELSVFERLCQKAQRSAPGAPATH